MAFGLFKQDGTSSLSPFDFKEVLQRAQNTQPGSNVRKLPLDNLAKIAQNATPKVIDAECTLDKLRRAYDEAREEAQVYIDTLKTEFEAKITDAEVTLHKAKTERKEAQYRCLRELIESGALNDVKDLNELARCKEFQEKA